MQQQSDWGRGPHAFMQSRLCLAARTHAPAAQKQHATCVLARTLDQPMTSAAVSASEAWAWPPSEAASATAAALGCCWRCRKAARSTFSLRMLPPFCARMVSMVVPAVQPHAARSAAGLGRLVPSIQQPLATTAGGSTALRRPAGRRRTFLAEPAEVVRYQVQRLASTTAHQHQPTLV